MHYLKMKMKVKDIVTVTKYCLKVSIAIVMTWILQSYSDNNNYGVVDGDHGQCQAALSSLRSPFVSPFSFGNGNKNKVNIDVDARAATGVMHYNRALAKSKRNHRYNLLQLQQHRRHHHHQQQQQQKKKRTGTDTQQAEWE